MESTITNPKPGNQERCWVAVFAISVMLITTIPYFVGYQNQSESWRFTGFVFNVGDGNNYIAKMLRGAAGDWLFRTPYSASPQQGVYAYFFHILLGKLTSPPGQHEQMVSLYHLARIIAGILMMLATYDFIAVFIKDIDLRRWGLILVSLGGGLGWFLVFIGQKNWLGSLPLEFYSPESFGFLILFGLPHLGFARALFLWGFVTYLRSEQIAETSQNGTLTAARPNRSGFLIGLIWLLMGIFQPLMVVLSWGILGIYFLVQNFGWLKFQVNKYQTQVQKNAAYLEFFKNKVQKIIGVISVSAPIVIYTLIAFNADPFHRQWTSQIKLPSPNPLHYLIAYAVLLPFAILGIVRIIQSKQLEGRFLVAWFMAFPLWVYAPYIMQRRLAEGFWVVVIVLALTIFDRSKCKRFKKTRYIWALVFPSTIFLLLGGFQAAQTFTRPVFVSGDEVAAFDYLAETGQPENVLLSSFETGNALPAWAPAFVVIGHGPESVGIAEIFPRVTEFYQAETADEQRRNLLDEFRVDYVFWGPSERSLGSWHTSTASYLKLVFSQGDVQVYSVDL